MTTSKKLLTTIRDLEYLVRGHRNRISTVRTAMSNVRFFDNSIEFWTKRIKQAQSAIDALTSDRDRGPQLIEREKVDMRRLRRRINVLKHQHELKRVRELYAKINALQKELPDHVLSQAIAAEDKA
jgi:predicted  nucleic acid-binding Zn-ribbon protein